MSTWNNLLKGLLYTMSILWSAWLIFKSHELLDNYITVSILIMSMIFNDLLNKKED